MRLWTALAGIGLLSMTFGVAAQLPADLALVRFPNASTNFSSPVAVRAPHDGSNRVFVVQKGGLIRIVKNGAVLATPFLSMTVTGSSESGLLGLAFHPNYGKPSLPHNDEFYIFYTRPSADPRLGTTPDQVVARYTVSAGNPDVANSAGTIVMRLPDLAGNHNGGDIHFGPDGYLYISSGDSGAQNNPHGFAECLWKKPADNNPSTCGTGSGTQYYLLGKMLRIDVDNRGGTVSADMCGSNGISPAEYSIPASNPHTGTTNTCDEIWSHGFRNPWRFSFDREDGRMVIGDVGQGQYEEITVDPVGVGGRDHGWSRCEGRHYFDTSGSGTTCPATTSTVAPVAEYSHGAGDCAVSGGFVFRGPIAMMRGIYFYGDSCTGRLWWANSNAGATWDAGGQNNTNLSSTGIYGFGEDEAGNLYVAQSNGNVSMLTSEMIFKNGFE